MEQILARAREQERDYDWLGGSGSYKKASDLISEQDLAKKADFQERLGYAMYRAAMQADRVDEFRERMRGAVAGYERAEEFYGRLGEQGRRLRCDAMIAYLGFWLTEAVAEKKRLVDEAWERTKKALEAFREHGGALEYGNTYNLLVLSALFSSNFDGKLETLEKTSREGLEHGEQAIRFLSTLGNPTELARAYVIAASWLEWTAWNFLPDPDEQDKYRQKAFGYWGKAKDLSEETALIQLPIFGGLDPGGPGSVQALTIFRSALEFGKKTKDRLIIGAALECLAFHSFWKTEGVEDPDEAVALLRKALQYAEGARHQFSLLLFISPGRGVIWPGAPHTEYYHGLALFETDPGKKRELLEKAAETIPDHLKLAKDSGYPYAIGIGHHVCSKTLASLARLETRTDARKSLLERALAYRDESIRISEELQPYSYWDLGVGRNYLSNIKSELAHLSKDPDNKKGLLQDAISTKEDCLESCDKVMQSFAGRGSLSQIAWIGERRFEYADLWNSLYDLTSDNKYLREAAQAFEHAAEAFGKPNLVSRMAECHWKAAQAYDGLGEHLKAAKEFVLASKNYDAAAEKIPQLNGFYHDHASYMQAWGEIEKARHHHGRQEYGNSKEFYERAADLHKSLKRWSFLASNYSAWARVENAEDLSRRENSEKAIRAFEEAAKLFLEGKKSIEAELGRIKSPDETQMATTLVKAADLRQEYCNARIILEEAKILDRKGDHYSSSEKYGQAAEIFEKTAGGLESDQSRQEFKLIITLSRAWQTITKAEASDSPELYLEASQLFEEAKGLSPTERTTMLSSGHSRFCRALEAGTRFADTREARLHATAIQHLESAANYYLKAGLQNASEYTKASKLLFDAYLFMDEASKEKDSEKKAKFYLMAEKVLQASADSYAKAQHPGKREQVLGLLEKVKGERELALSLTEVLHAPAFVSTTSTFATPTPTYERAVGLERFEHAVVQASMITRQKSLRVGEDLALEIELVNAGKGPAQLIKVEELIPEGFELTGKPEPYRVEDSYLNMKGKRLDPLKTEEVKLVLRPKVQGQFTLKPRILYLDESGRYKSHEPEAIEVTVKELGISGWIKGH